MLILKKEAVRLSDSLSCKRFYYNLFHYEFRAVSLQSAYIYARTQVANGDGHIVRSGRNCDVLHLASSYVENLYCAVGIAVQLIVDGNLVACRIGVYLIDGRVADVGIARTIHDTYNG